MPRRDPTTSVKSLPQSAATFSLLSSSLLSSPFVQSRRSTKRAINRLTSSRACPEYCPSMGPTCARVERSSFFRCISAPSSPLHPFFEHPLCNIRSTKDKKLKKWEWEFELSAFSLSFARRTMGTTASALQRGEREHREDCEITRWRLPQRQLYSLCRIWKGNTQLILNAKKVKLSFIFSFALNISNFLLLPRQFSVHNSTDRRNK